MRRERSIRLLCTVVGGACVGLALILNPTRFSYPGDARWVGSLLLIGVGALLLLRGHGYWFRNW